MVGMGVIEAEQREAFFGRQPLHAKVVLRRDLVAPRALGPDVFHPLEGHDPRRVSFPPEQRPDTLVRIGVAAVRADLFEEVFRHRDHVALQRSPERYLLPPSGRTVTIVAGSGPSRATWRAAKTFAPADGPTKTPSSLASLRHLSEASSVA